MLITSPKTVLPGWHQEINKWIPEKSISIHSFAEKEELDTKYYKLQQWEQSEGTSVLLISYHTLRSLIEARDDRSKKPLAEISRRDQIRQKISSILRKVPEMLVCDEGHILRSEDTAVTRALVKIQTKRKIVLTSSPLQNSLQDFFFLSEFVRKGKLGSFKDFETTYIHPIM